jgi:hypothetical protein
MADLSASRTQTVATGGKSIPLVTLEFCTRAH